MKPAWKMAVVVLAASLNFGCASMFEMGEQPTECPVSLDPGLPCTSAREVMELTSSPDGISREKKKRLTAAEVGNDTPAHDKAVETAPQMVAPAQAAAANHQREILDSFLPAPEPIAVRQPPKMLRVSFAPWEDNKGRLQNVGYVYSEVQERKYRYGRGMLDRPARITPLQIRQISLEDERQMNPQNDQGLGIVTQAQQAANEAMGRLDRTPQAVRDAWPEGR